MELELTEPPDKFIGEAVVLDVSTIQNGHGITSSNLEKDISIVKSGDIVLLYKPRYKMRRNRCIEYRKGGFH